MGGEGSRAKRQKSLFFLFAREPRLCMSSILCLVFNRIEVIAFQKTLLHALHFYTLTTAEKKS